MASLYITEFEMLGDVKSPSSSSWNGSVQIAGTPPIAEQVIAIGVNIQSAAFNIKTHYVRLHADAICSVEWGSNPSATTSNMRLVAGQTEYFGVSPGSKLAVIANV